MRLKEGTDAPDYLGNQPYAEWVVREGFYETGDPELDQNILKLVNRTLLESISKLLMQEMDVVHYRREMHHDGKWHNNHIFVAYLPLFNELYEEINKLKQALEEV